MNTKNLLLLGALALGLQFHLNSARADTVSWTGGGDGTSWADAANWSGGAVPGPTNDVVITSGAGTTVVISSGSITVKSIQCSKAFTISGGSLTATAGASQINGDFTLASGTSLSAIGSNTTFTSTSSITADGAAFSATSGAVLSLPGLRSYWKQGGGHNPSWEASGTNSALVFPALTNIVSLYYYNLNVTALAGGRVVLTNLASLDGTVAIKADGVGSVVEVARLTTVTGTDGAASFTVQNGGAIPLPVLAVAQNAALNVGANSTLSLPALWDLSRGSLTLSGGQTMILPALSSLDTASLSVSGGSVLSLPGLRSYWRQGGGYNPSWEASGTNSALVFPALTNIVSLYYYNLNVTALAGGRVVLTNLASLDGTVVIKADGVGSRVDLTGLSDVVFRSGSQLSFTAQNQGFIDLHRVQSISGYGCSFLATGTNSVIDLSSLSGFITPLGASSLTAQDGGVILLNKEAWLLGNVAINIPTNNPVLPPTLVASNTMTLYGTAWNSYWVEKRDTRFADSPWVFAARVPLTNAFQAFAPVPPPNTAFRVWEFVADPAILDLNRVAGGQLQPVLYGAPPKSFTVQTTPSLDAQPAVWSPAGLSTGPMTNAFRIFPAFTPSDPKRFYRSKEL